MSKSSDTSTTIRVGTASWSEPEFVKAGWYPKGLAAGQRLVYYAQFFDYVELNSSFYAIPAAKMCEKWVQRNVGELSLRREVPPAAFQTRDESGRACPPTCATRSS